MFDLFKRRKGRGARRRATPSMFAEFLEYFGEAPVLEDGAADPYDAVRTYWSEAWAAGRSAMECSGCSSAVISRDGIGWCPDASRSFAVSLI